MESIFIINLFISKVCNEDSKKGGGEEYVFEKVERRRRDKGLRVKWYNGKR